MNARPAILIYSRDAQRYGDWLREHGCPGTLHVATSREEAEARLRAVDVLFCWRFPADLFAETRRLRWVQAMGAGVEDLVGAPGLSAQVAVTRVVDQFGVPMAEYVFAELLARVRGLETLRDMQRRRAWEPLEVRTLAGLTIGVAGLGSIGREMVRKARAFDMRVLGLSRTGDAPAGMDRLFRPDEWLSFVQDLDVLVLTLPLTAETEGVVNRDVLAAMPDRALLVNVGRGGLIVEEELVAALRSGNIAGAVLDVFAQEPLPADSPLWTMPGVTVTPHISGPSTIDGVAGYFLANLYRYMRGDPLVGMVDRARGY